MPYDPTRWKVYHEVAFQHLCGQIAKQYTKDGRWNLHFADRYIAVYLRRSVRFLPGPNDGLLAYSTTELGGIEVQPEFEGIGFATRMLDFMERIADVHRYAFFIEQILNPAFERIVLKRPGYTASGRNLFRIGEAQPCRRPS